LNKHETLQDVDLNDRDLGSRMSRIKIGLQSTK
jgi:hypothetical protein